MKDFETHSKLLTHYLSYDSNFTNDEFSVWIGELANLHAEYNQ
jgi:hypothetical protein